MGANVLRIILPIVPMALFATTASSSALVEVTEFRADKVPGYFVLRVQNQTDFAADVQVNCTFVKDGTKISERNVMAWKVPPLKAVIRSHQLSKEEHGATTVTCTMKKLEPVPASIGHGSSPLAP